MQRVSDLVAKGDLGAIIDHVIGLNRKKALIDKELDEAKAYLRKVAKEKKSGAFSVDLEGLSGAVTVTFPGLALKAKKGADLSELKVNLPELVFAQLFKHSIVVVPALPPEDFLEELRRQSEAHQATVRHFIEIEEQTAKVYVPR